MALWPCGHEQRQYTENDDRGLRRIAQPHSLLLRANTCSFTFLPQAKQTLRYANELTYT